MITPDLITHEQEMVNARAALDSRVEGYLRHYLAVMNRVDTKRALNTLIFDLKSEVEILERLERGIITKIL